MATRRIRSYVRREGRMTSGQRRAIARLWPRYGLEVEDGMVDLPGCFSRPAPLVVEIGFGMGDSLAETADARRDLNFIGIEVHRPGVGHLLHLAETLALDNLRVFNADGVDVLGACLADACAHRIQIFFPDPWHKKRHHKRRLIAPDFAAVLEVKLAPGGILHVATDWPDYADSIAEVMGRTTSLESVPPPDRVVTKYERRGVELGHRVVDMAWRKSS